MITGCYLPTWCKLELDDGRTVNALVFIMDPRHPLFEPDTSAQVIAPLIARASGPLGTNAQYLFSLDQELRKLGMHDACLDDLVGKVRAAGRSPTPGWPENARHDRALLPVRKKRGLTGVAQPISTFQVPLRSDLRC
jgi:cation transport protein ChaC